MAYFIYIIIGLVIWFVLPDLILKTKAKKMRPIKKAVKLICFILGILIIILSSVELIKSMFNKIF
jgi:hypothetical protein